MEQRYTINRELSWLEFNLRVLDESVNKSIPLLERLKFLGIFISNLTEFFMVRVGYLTDVSRVCDDKIDLKSGLSPSQQLNIIYKKVHKLYNLQNKIYLMLTSELSTHDISILNYNDLNDSEKKEVYDFFCSDMKKHLEISTLTKYKAKDFYNKQTYLIVMLEKENAKKYVCVSYRKLSGEYYAFSNNRIILFESIILEFCNQLFDEYNIVEKNIIMITRNAEVSFDNVDYIPEDVLSATKQILKIRKKQLPVRLEVFNKNTKETIKFLSAIFKLEQNKIFYSSTPLNFSFINSFYNNLDIKKYNKLFYAKHKQNEYALSVSSVLKKDRLLSYPYDSIEVFYSFLEDAILNKDCSKIYITMYRLSKNSKLINLLIKAAKKGIFVVCIIELRARFDEENNINYAKKLEESGCMVYYGLDEYKCHSKMSLIEFFGKRKYQIAQIGTGNFNEVTSKQYTDLSYITAKENICEEVSKLFDNLISKNFSCGFKELLVSPINFKTEILDLIDKQIMLETNGYIFIKINAITDIDIINKLIFASKSGVKIDMVVRSACSIIPQIDNISNNIFIKSIVGRYLEHSRIYQFGKGLDAKMYIASADFMTRNTTKRIELACPIYDIDIKEKLQKMITYLLKDTKNSYILTKTGKYESVYNTNFDSQNYLLYKKDKE